MGKYLELARRASERLDQFDCWESNTSSWEEIPRSQWDQVLEDPEAFLLGRYIVTSAFEPSDYPIVLCSNEETVSAAKAAGIIPHDAAVFTGAEYAMLISIADKLSLEDVREICDYKRTLTARLVGVKDLHHVQLGLGPI